MRNIFRSLFIALSCLTATSVLAEDVTFTMSSIFDGSALSVEVTAPASATVSTTTSKSNSKDGKLGSDGNYFEIILKEETFTAVSINGFINTTDQTKNWAFQFSTDKGSNWTEEAKQPNDGNKADHDIAVELSIPANANGFRVIRRAGTATHVNSITLTLGSATPSTDPVSSVTLLGPDAIYVGQKASFGASPDVKADAFKWTVDGIEQEGATSVLFEYSPAVGTYAIQAFAKNEYNSDWVASNIINLVVSEKTELEQVPVTEATVWDWTKAGTGSIEWKENTTPRKDIDTVLLANVEGINNNAEFNSQALLFAGQYPIRDGKYCQGPWISFKTTVAGYVQVEFSNTGGGDRPERFVAVNGIVNTEIGSANTSKVTSASIAVEAGDIVIQGSFEEFTEPQYLRIYKITFSTEATPAEKSSDNTLKSLTYNGTPVPGFSPSERIYNIELPAETTEVPEVKAEANNENATVEVIPATALPGTTSIKVTAENGDEAIYKINFTIEGTEPPAPVAVTGVTLNHNTLTLKVGYSQKLIATVAPVDATNTNVTWSSDKTNIATVYDGIVTAIAAGTATIKVKTEDGGYEASCEVRVEEEETPDVPVPPTDLALHEPGTYEETSAKGGYDAQLSVVDHREYEVYYGSYDSESNLSVTTEPQTKAEGITTSIDQTSFQAKDNWFKGAAKGGKSDYTFSEQDEFSFAGKGALHKMLNGDVYEFHIKGYDQFSIIGKDNNADASKGRHLEVYVDTVLQTMTLATEPTLRRFDISSKEHVIRVKAIHDGDSKSELYCFSLRVAQVPTVKYLRGNDSTQVVLQTADLPRPVYYYTKYNNSFGGTRVVWEREEAYGIELSVKGSDEIGDTLMLSGKAMCAVGEYPFHVESYDLKGNVIKSLPSGKFTVASDIRAVGEPEVTVYQNEEMEKLEFLYHALSADEITLDWSSKKPAGITGSGENGKYYISGTPTEVGDFSFTISVKDGNSIEGSVSVKEAIIGDNLALYLYTNKDADTKDGVKALLESKGYKFVPRIAKREGLRPAEDYKKYSWVMISEDANADNLEVLALTKESAILPVLNMKAFSYANERLSWGDPDNGTVKVPDALSITVQRDDHPIFQALHKSKGDKIQVLDTLLSKGLMPIDINLPGTFCLATALTRSREYYDESGEPQTFLHEVPAGMRGGKKYICLPIAISSSNKLTKEGEQLIEEVVKYLLSDEQSGLTPPQLQIESFIIDDIAGKIDQSANKISFEIDLSEHKDLIKEAIVPEVVITSDYTHVTPASGDTIDFSDSWSFPVPYEVSDYINRRVYEVSIRFFSSEGIEDVYAAGDWVHIYDIFGRQVSTTNEDVYHMVLPRGIYIVVTETGEAFKIMR